MHHHMHQQAHDAGCAPARLVQRALGGVLAQESFIRRAPARALDAAADASDDTAELGFVPSPDPPFPVTDPGEVFPLWSGQWPEKPKRGN